MRIFCIIALLSLPVALMAQEDQTLSREMTLEREYDPSVQDANKVNTLPAIKEPEVRKMPIDYATFTTPGVPQREIGLLPPGSIMTDVAYNQRRGYVNFGICAGYMNINGDLGYHLISTDKNQLDFFFSHRSTNGKVKYLQEREGLEKVKAKLNDNLGGLNYRHQFEKAALKLGVQYGYSNFNYYGLPPVVIPGTTGFIIPENDSTKQVNQEISAIFGIESREDADVGYHLDLGYTNFSYKYGPGKEWDGITEHSIGGKAGLSAAFGGNQRVGLDGIFNYFNYSLPAVAPGLSTVPLFENYFEGTLSPYYKVEGENWNIKLGVSAMFITGEYDKFLASPNVAMDVTIGSKTVLYLDAGGEIRSNSAYLLSRENRYIDPWTMALPSKTWLDGTIGLKSGTDVGFWFNVFAGYKITDDDYFFIPQQNYAGFANVSSVLPLNSKRFQGGLEMKYAYRNIFEIMLKGVYNNWDVEDGSLKATEGAYIREDELKAFGRPEMELTAGITIRPFDGLSIMADYYLATGRETLSPFLFNLNSISSYYDPLVPYPSASYVLSNSVEKMKNINELNLTGTYTFNKTLGVYAKLSNLLFQKYEMIYGYPLQKFSAMVGVNINF